MVQRSLLFVTTLFFATCIVIATVVPLEVVAREKKRCDGADSDDPCASRAAKLLVAYGLIQGVPQTLVGAWLGGVADARGPRLPMAVACVGGAASAAAAAAYAWFELPFAALAASGALFGLAGGYFGLLTAAYAYAARAPAAAAVEPSDSARGPEAAATAGFRPIAVSLFGAFAAAPVAAGVAAERFGSAATLAAAAAAFLVSLAAVAFLVPPVAAKPAAGAPRGALASLRDAGRGVALLLSPSSPAFALSVAWGLIMCNATGGGFVVQYLARTMSKGEVGLYASILGAMAAAGALIGEPLAARLAPGRDANLALARCGPFCSGLLALGLALVPPRALGGKALFCLLPLAAPLAAANPAHRALVVEAIGESDAGKVLGGLGAVESLVGLVAPALLGAAYAALARAGRPAAANYPLVATAAAAFALLVFAPPRRKKLGGTLSEALLATDAISC